MNSQIGLPPHPVPFLCRDGTCRPEGRRPEPIARYVHGERGVRRFELRLQMERTIKQQAESALTRNPGGFQVEIKMTDPHHSDKPDELPDRTIQDQKIQEQNIQDQAIQVARLNRSGGKHSGWINQGR
ncbi:MAG TPA: hypothetical protein VHX20_17850 [Terracidiphilus sp.]|jgi:hypothetical protein|nr:hypothetical protein [Terracidiphilus sp.]